MDDSKSESMYMVALTQCLSRMKEFFSGYLFYLKNKIKWMFKT